MADDGMNCRHTEDWPTLPWKKLQRNVRRLQQRIYRAERRGDRKRVHALQRLLLRSWSARCLAVRKVTQENHGKRTPGVDGIASLTPPQRLALAHRLRDLSGWQAAPIRRVYIDKRGTTEKRGLGIPTMADRAMQALVKLALEPEWEAHFEPNSYGFRPGRSTHDAIEAIFNAIHLQPKYVLDADLEKCFDRIDRAALLAKLHAIQPTQRLVHQWLQAGILDGDQWSFPQTGTPQGGVISPLLANVALHGLERALTATVPHKRRPHTVRYADDLVILCPNRERLDHFRQTAATWLTTVGLNFKLNKTRITHTLEAYEGRIGFDFLGFHVQQYAVGQHRTPTYRGRPGFKTLIRPSRGAVKQHLQETRAIIRSHRGLPQAALIAALNPVIRGWASYYRTCAAKRTLGRLDWLLYQQLAQWAHYRHPRKTPGWRYRRYWKRQGSRVDFSDGANTLLHYANTPIVRYVKV